MATQIKINSLEKDSRIGTTMDMCVGDVALILEPTSPTSKIEKDIIFKTYLGFINLKNPIETWKDDPNFKVQFIKELNILYVI